MRRKKMRVFNRMNRALAPEKGHPGSVHPVENPLLKKISPPLMMQSVSILGA
jgi:hypothetical protein